jgi:hypothetical protein
MNDNDLRTLNRKLKRLMEFARWVLDEAKDIQRVLEEEA